MADVDIAVQKTGGATGLSGPTYTAIATGNTYHVPNNGKMILNFVKSGAGQATITLQTSKTYRGLAIADPTRTVPASTGDVFVGPFPPELYNDVDGEVLFTTDEGTGLTCAPLDPSE